jgi:hypothetical protein
VTGRAFERKLLHRRWVHAGEEDREGEMVFRPAEYGLPPARGRVSLELREDGTLIERQPGATDAPREAKGAWRLEESELVLEPEDAPSRRLALRALEREKLVLARPAGSSRGA